MIKSLALVAALSFLCVQHSETITARRRNPAYTGPPFVQGSTNNSGGFTCVWTSASLTAGNQLFAAMVATTGGTLTAADSAGDTFVQVNAAHTFTSVGVGKSWWVSSLVGGTTTVTLTTTVNTNFTGCGFAEFHGASSVDQVGELDIAANGSGGNFNLASTSAGIAGQDLVFGFISNQSDAVYPHAVGTGFCTLIDPAIVSPVGLIVYCPTIASGVATPTVNTNASTPAGVSFAAAFH